MKKSIHILALTAFAAGTIFISCNSSAEKVDAAKANIETIEHDLITAKEDYYKEYNKFKYESDKRITENTERIAELKGRSRKMKKEIKSEYEKTIANLQIRNDALKAKMDEYKEDGKDKWESFKREFNHDMDELGQSITGLVNNNVN
ncbi:MAG: hypothetical protein A3K10_06490 [Bacteroidetes bacterium RIFCSPLOWO2_12_FULL_31_6]|nr:MAG: hypothetical protein A3K10_06490 [Bacteroidetes bacterium RIFCSPLOWO2_12_FULL_31_6]